MNPKAPQRRPGRGAGPPDATRRPPVQAAPPLPLRHPATIATCLVALACVVFSVTYRIFDTDFWQHLLVGRVIWQTHGVPREHLWSWVSYGRPEVLPSWLFRAALWPFDAALGVTGLFLWRWATTLAAFAFLWAAARRMGARGLTPLVVLVWCAWIYRVRTQLRPETLAAVLMALELWLLESRRARLAAGESLRPLRDPVWWLVPITWVWANAHASYFIAFVLLAVHGADEALRRRGRANPRPLALAALAMLAAGLANPFGARTLWLPFDYALHLSHESLFQGISELAPMRWAGNARSGVWLMIALWPVLALWRARREGTDWAELATCALATAYALPSQRFVGVYALAAGAYLARDVDAWIRARRWPSWTSRPAFRAALASLACLAVGVPEALRPAYRPGIGIEMERFPVKAADFIARHGVRGRGISSFRAVGYLAWRFWPERDRLPFTDIHQSGTPADREAYAAAFLDPRAGWPEVSSRYRLDYAVLDRRIALGAPLLDVVDADSAWRLVFVDDDAALYVRRSTLAAVADSFGYSWLGGGGSSWAALERRALADSAARPALRAELERASADSPWNASAEAALATLALAQGRDDEAAEHLRRVLSVDPALPGIHRGLGLIALWRRESREAIDQLERERRLHGALPGLELDLGIAWEQLGDVAHARAHFERELAADPGNAEARARLDSLTTAR